MSIKLLFFLSVENDNSMWINRYVFFWVVLLTSKLAFSFYVEVNSEHFMEYFSEVNTSLEFGDLLSTLFHECEKYIFWET